MVMNFSKANKPKSLESKDLRWECNPNIFNFDSTEHLEPIEGIIGQDRALKALKMGLEINAPGYNIFVTGLSGTGKATTIQKILERLDPDTQELKDYAYVNNFVNPENPRLIVFPAGEAIRFSDSMDMLIDFLLAKIPQVLESEVFISKRKFIMDEFAVTEKTMMSEFEKRIKKDGFALGQIQMGEYYRPEILPVIENTPVNIQEIKKFVDNNKISEQSADELISKYQGYTIELQELFKKGLKLSQEFQEKTVKLEQETVSLLVEGAVQGVSAAFPHKQVTEYLGEVMDSILNSLHLFKQPQKSQVNNEQEQEVRFSPFRVYEVNVILDNSEKKKCPVLIETSPNYTNIFGSIEKVYAGHGTWTADFMNIRAGALLKANGGYLVLNGIDALSEPGVWRGLKRALLYRKLEIQDNSGAYQMYYTSLKPESIELTTKVIFIGSHEIYNMLISYEEDFKKIFKVKADFDYEMNNSEKALLDMARLIKKLSKEEKLLNFDKTAVAELAEYSARYVDNKEKLTTRFAVIADLAREANYWAVDNGASIVMGIHVLQAIENAKERYNMSDEKIEEMILKNDLIIETSGSKIGEINGLAVYGSAEAAFGKPTKITANVSIGNAGIVNIEREAKLSGRTHDKGVLILASYLRSMFSHKKPVSFTAGICFEQSYSGVDGDSASSTEIYVLLSALSEIPIKQSIAVTGSVNQKGIIQPIGGVNEKIEGFYKICKKRGLDGTHGVIIPKLNVRNLMLAPEIVESVNKKLFSVYAIEKIEQGIEILTGIKAGKLLKNGEWEKDTVFYYTDKKLKEMTKLAKDQPAQNNKRKKSSKTGRK